MPLEAAWVIRHIGINHEYAERLTDAEKYYDESLALFRKHASDNDNNYANTVRYPAVIKNRVGKRDESTALWEEAVRRYDEMDQPLGVAEGARLADHLCHRERRRCCGRRMVCKGRSSGSGGKRSGYGQMDRGSANDSRRGERE